jgi:tetratricopeptide (TPR) repeat protein
MQKKNPDWEAAEKKLLAVINEVPDFYPAKYNYAITLLKRGLMDIAEPVIREIVENFPEYLFARSTLLQILLADNRVDEAEELITSLPGIEETHSDAMAVWMTGQSIYYEHLEDYEKAADYSQQAYDLAPHLPAVQRLWESYQ